MTTMMSEGQYWLAGRESGICGQTKDLLGRDQSPWRSVFR